MALEDYLTVRNFLYLVGAIVVVLIAWYLIRKSSSWSRPSEEKIELGEEKDLEKTTKQEIKLEKNEKKIIKQLIKNFILFWIAMS